MPVMEQFVLKATNLTCNRGQRCLFSNLNFKVGSGNLLQITGRNGSGKTSLLRLLCGLLTPDTGEIYWQQQRINHNWPDYWQQLHYLSANTAFKSSLTVRENLKLFQQLQSISAQNNHKWANDIMQRLGLYPQRDLLAKQLSTGQQRRLSLARLFVAKKKLWLLDEPLNGLDQWGIDFIRESIAQHCEMGGIAIVVSHTNVFTAELEVNLDHVD